MELLSGFGFVSVCSLLKCFFGFSKPALLFLLLAAPLCCFSGGKALNSVEKVTYAGETVILPCYVTVDHDNVIPTVEWSKQGLHPDIVFLYRDGCETFAEKNPAYRYRTNLLLNELKNGNLSLMISNVQPSDAGKYICKTIQKRPRVVATVELIVGIVSEPKLSVVPGGEGGVTLQCEVTCWLQQPTITFLNSQGNIISDGDTKIYQDSKRRCFNATRRLTVQTADRFTCRVDQPTVNQMRLTEILIPDECVRSCTTATIIAAAVTVMIISGVLCTAALLWKKCPTLTKQDILSPQSSRQSSTRSNVAGGEQAEPDQNAPDELLRNMNTLKSNLHEKDELICRLTDEVNDLKAKLVNLHCRLALFNSPSTSPPNTSLPPNLPPDQLPHNNSPQPAASTSSNHLKPARVSWSKDSRPGVAKQLPAFAPPIQKKSHNNSSPAFLTHSEAEPPGPSDHAHVGRSMSMSEPRARPNVAKAQRRVSMSTSNRFTVLANLPEDDAEPLLQGKREHGRNQVRN